MKKKITNIASPFIMLLIPMFFLIALLAVNVNNEIPAEKRQASLKLQVPTLKNLIQGVIQK